MRNAIDIIHLSAFFDFLRVLAFFRFVPKCLAQIRLSFTLKSFNALDVSQKSRNDFFVHVQTIWSLTGPFYCYKTRQPATTGIISTSPFSKEGFSKHGNVFFWKKHHQFFQFSIFENFLGFLPMKHHD